MQLLSLNFVMPEAALQSCLNSETKLKIKQMTMKI